MLIAGLVATVLIVSLAVYSVVNGEIQWPEAVVYGVLVVGGWVATVVLGLLWTVGVAVSAVVAIVLVFRSGLVAELSMR